MMRLSAIVLSILLADSVTGPTLAAETVLPVAHQTFAPGQVWAIKLDDDPEATLEILRIEGDPVGGEIIFISLAGTTSLSGIPPIAILPFPRDAIETIVLRLIRTEPPPRELIGYDTWKNSGATIIRVSVSDTLKGIRKSIEATSSSSCDYDRKRLLAMDQDAFDQDMTGGWRKLALNEKCLGVAADLLRDYRTTNGNKAPILFWHEGQLRATMGLYREAIPLLEMARQPPESSTGWNEYVAATVAFLRNDRTAFDQARATLAALPRPPGFDAHLPDGKPVPWPMNLDVVDRLGRCFGSPYKEAYALCQK